MVEKHYCDVCGEETQEAGNFTVESPETIFDICVKCLINKTLPEILRHLHSSTPLKFNYVNIDLPDNILDEET
jgi:hypothetical protein